MLSASAMLSITMAAPTMRPSPGLNRSPDADAEAFDQLLRACSTCKNGDLIASRSMMPMKALDSLLLLRLLSNELAAVDEEIEPVNGQEATSEPADRREKRTHLERPRHHFEADGCEQHPAGKAESKRHEQRRRLQPEGD